MKLFTANKNIIFYGSLFAVIGLMIYLSYSNLDLQKKNDEAFATIKSLRINLDNKKDFEGKFLWDQINVSQQDFSVFNTRNNLRSGYIFIIVDTIKCFSCFKFHMEKLRELEIPIVFYSKNKHDLIKSYLPNSINFTENTTHKFDNGILVKENIVITLINKEGKIIYIDIADKTNYEKSRIFYQIIKNYIVN